MAETLGKKAAKKGVGEEEGSSSVKKLCKLKAVSS